MAFVMRQRQSYIPDMHTLGKSTIEQMRRRGMSRGGFLTVESESYDGGSSVATLEPRVVESGSTRGTPKTASGRANANQPTMFTIDLLGDWCKP